MGSWQPSKIMKLICAFRPEVQMPLWADLNRAKTLRLIPDPGIINVGFPLKRCEVSDAHRLYIFYCVRNNPNEFRKSFEISFAGPRAARTDSTLSFAIGTMSLDKIKTKLVEAVVRGSRRCFRRTIYECPIDTN